MAKWVARREICYVDAVVPSGTILDGVPVDELLGEDRRAFRRVKRRLALSRPDLTLVTVRFEGKIRWVHAPDDVRMHLVSTGSLLRRRTP